MWLYKLSLDVRNRMYWIGRIGGKVLMIKNRLNTKDIPRERVLSGIWEDVMQKTRKGQTCVVEVRTLRSGVQTSSLPFHSYVTLGMLLYPSISVCLFVKWG